MIIRKDGINKKILSVFLAGIMVLIPITAQADVLDTIKSVGAAAGEKIEEAKDAAGSVLSSAGDTAGGKLKDFADNAGKVIDTASSTISDGVSFVGDKLQGAGESVSEFTTDMLNEAKGVLTSAGIKAAEKAHDVGTTVINGVTVVGDTLIDQMDFILKYQIGETKIVPGAKQTYDVYISHTVLTLLEGASSEIVQKVTEYIVDAAAAFLPGVVGKTAETLRTVVSDFLINCKDKMKEVDEGSGVILRINTLNLLDVFNMKDHIFTQEVIAETELEE